MTSDFKPELGQTLFGAEYGAVRVPEADYGYLTEQLLALSRKLVERGCGTSVGILGPRDGYGAEFRNDVFEMHPYHWGGCACGLIERAQKWHTEHVHKSACFHTELMAMEFPDGFGGKHHEASPQQLQALCIKHGVPWHDGQGVKVRCTCGHQEASVAWHRDHGHAPECPVGRPNFQCGDVQVRWYKYIGRGLSLNREIDRQGLEAMFQRCFGSILS